MQLDHVTIRTRDIEATRLFFAAVFDMAEGRRPAAIRRIPGAWMYAAGRPLVHIIATSGDGPDHAADAIDHVGFRLDNYVAFRARLDRLGILYSCLDLPEIDERRLFLRAPGGPLLEAVFAAPGPAPGANA
jgi:catechol 2,3-dioxygenase-like lactoylglutathione lyase family enzyme